MSYRWNVWDITSSIYVIFLFSSNKVKNANSIPFYIVRMLSRNFLLCRKANGEASAATIPPWLQVQPRFTHSALVRILVDTHEESFATDEDSSGDQWSVGLEFVIVTHRAAALSSRRIPYVRTRNTDRRIPVLRTLQFSPQAVQGIPGQRLPAVQSACNQRGRRRLR